MNKRLLSTNHFAFVIALIHLMAVMLICAWTFYAPRGDVMVGMMSLVRLDYPLSLFFLRFYDWAKLNLPLAADILFVFSFVMLGTGWYYGLARIAQVIFTKTRSQSHS